MKNAINLAVTLGLTVSSLTPAAALPQWQKPGILQPTLAETQLNKAAIKDGIHQTWTIDKQTEKGGEVLEITDGWMHIKASEKSGNSVNDASKFPAMFVNPDSFDFSAPGFFKTTIKSTQDTAQNRFGFYLGYKDPGNGLFIGYDAGGWFHQMYKDGKGTWKAYGGRPAANEETSVRIEWNIVNDGKDSKRLAKLIVNNQTIFENLDISEMELSDKIAIKASTYETQITDVYLQNMDYTGLNEDATLKYNVTGILQDESGNPVKNAAIMIGDEIVRSGEDGSFLFDSKFISGDYNMVISKAGYQDYQANLSIKDQHVDVKTIVLTPEHVTIQQIASSEMNVELNANFPSVRKYELGNKTMFGQTKNINTMRINGVDIKVNKDDVSFKKEGDSKAIYTMHIKDEANHVDAFVTAELVVDGNKLHFAITEIKNNLDNDTYPVQTISIPDHSLVAVHSNQKGASFTGAVMSSDTNKNGDETFAVEDGMKAVKDKDYMYAFISNDELSAGMWSNSEHEGRVVYAPVYGGSQNTRILATSKVEDNYTTLGLASAPWYYHRIVTDSKGDSHLVKETEMPKMSIVITEDANDDQKVNWQDGAVAFRSIMNNPYKSEEVPELVAWRIAMNFGGQAQNPFLTTLDNVKKVALHTDGLGQSILLKGYGNEGHDSGHPDYGDIGKRIGGAKDMNMLMDKGKEYGARFGIHVNASEMYPEAKAFNEELVRRKNGNLSYGWNWLDQGIGIDGIYDLASGARANRFAELKAQVGDRMDFIYLDVWGNRTASVEDSWETRKISKQIIDNGWRMTTEWGSGNEYDSTFQHWAADLTYGGSTSKGENSQVMRFLRNHQKDSWVGDYPSYGGAANAPLLGGYNMKDFEGWQGRNDYDAYITNLYTHDLSTKFIQHYKVCSWVNNPLDSTSVNDASINNGNEQITLQDDQGNTLVISRATNDQNSADYRHRTMTLNGNVILDGKVSKGDGTGKGNESYLLPWNWDSTTGKSVASENEKLYHWNTAGGTTKWQLPSSWASMSNVKVYKLTDLGKQDEKTVAVTNGEITLEADAETPYVICKGDEANLNITWSEGMHIVDAGFNGGEDSLKDHWKIAGDGDATIAKSQFSNPMLKLSGDVSTTQTLTDLVPGKKYAIYVGVDNRSDSKASMRVNANGKELAANYTEESIAKNYVKAYSHNTNSATVDGSSYFQNMYVFFTAPKDGSEVTLTLQHEKDGDVYFDDIRIVENNADNIVLDEDGNLKEFKNDFEQNAQGLYPFVVSGSEGVEDNRVHLSEKHAPYTQAGWDVKKMDDVLNGDWSVKVNGLVQKNTLVYQTIPQNVRFEPGKKYEITFNYQAGSDDTYAVAIGNGEFNAGSVELQPLKKSLGTTSTYTFELTGSLEGDTWFGIYSTSAKADTQGTSSSAASFGGYLDFVLDDLSIKQVDENFSKEDAVSKLKELETKYEQRNFNTSAWNLYQETLIQACVLLNKELATNADYQNAFYMLRALEAYMETAPDAASDAIYDIALDSYEVSAGSAQPQTGNEGPVDFAQDGVDGTHWHTKWGDTNLNNAWYQFDLKEPATIDGIRYLPRSGAANANGKIKDFKVILTLSNGETKEMNSTFETGSHWQKFSFEKTEQVVSVRLKVESSAGQSATQENCFAAASELRLTTEIHQETENQVDKTALSDLVSSASKLTENDYEKDSWDHLQKMITAAQQVLDDKTATAYDVALALANVQDAIDALVNVTPVPEVNKQALETAIKDAEAKDISLYTAQSVSAMQDALKQAKAVYAQDDATQKQVDDACKALVESIKGLRLKEEVKADKTALMKQLTMALTFHKANYTEESFQELIKAIALAQNVLENETATQEEIDAAYAALDQAMNHLVPVQHIEQDPDKNPDKDTDKDTSQDTDKNPEKGDSVDTGDHTDLNTLLFLAVLSGGIVVFANKKRKQQH